MSTSIADVFVQIGVNGLSVVTSALSTVKNYLASLGAAASSMLNNLAGSGGIIGGLATAFQGILGIGSGLISVISGVAGTMMALVPVAMSLGNAFYHSLNIISGARLEQLVNFGASIATAVGKAFASLGPAIEKAITLIAPHFGKLAPLINAAIAKGQQVASLAALLGQLFVSEMADKLAGLGVVFANAWNSVKQAAASAGSAVVNAFVQQFQAIDNLLGGKLSAAGMKIKIIASVIKTNFQQAFAQISAQMPQILAALGPVGTGITKILQGIKTTASGVGSALTAALGPPAAVIMQGLMVAATGAASAISKIGTVASSAGAAIQAMYMNVVPIFGALFNFVSGGISKLIGMARSLVSALLTPLRMLKDFIFSAQGMLAGLVGTLSAAAVGKYIVEVTSDAEQAAVAFDVMLQSADKAREMLRQIQELADKTPLQLPEVRQGARTLLAMNVAAREVVPTLRMLGDVSQGVQQPLNDIVQIYGKINQKNRIMGDDLRQFGRRGIPVVRELAKEYNTTTDAIYEMARQGKLHFKDLELAFKKLTGEGGEFHNLMERMSGTIAGRFSTLQDAVRAVAIQVGDAIAPAIKKAINYFIEFAEWSKDAIQPFKAQIAEFAEYVAGRIPPLISMLKTSLPVLMETAKTTFSVIKAVHGITDALLTAIAEMVGGTESIANGFMRIVKEIRFVAEEWKLLFQIAEAYFKYLGSNTKGVFSQLFADLRANLEHIGSNLMRLLKLAMDYLHSGLTKAAHEFASIMFGDVFGTHAKAIAKAKQLMGFNEEQMGARIKLMFKNMPGFNLPTILGLKDPTLKRLLDALEGKHKMFWLKEAAAPWLAIFDKAKAFFNAKKADLGGPQGEHETVEKDKGKIGFESLTEYAKNIQQSVTPQQQKMQKLAEQQLDANKRTAIAVEKLAARPIAGAAFGV